MQYLLKVFQGGVGPLNSNKLPGTILVFMFVRCPKNFANKSGANKKCKIIWVNSEWLLQSQTQRQRQRQTQPQSRSESLCMHICQLPLSLSFSLALSLSSQRSVETWWNFGAMWLSEFLVLISSLPGWPVVSLAENIASCGKVTCKFTDISGITCEATAARCEYARACNWQLQLQRCQLRCVANLKHPLRFPTLLGN